MKWNWITSAGPSLTILICHMHVLLLITMSPMNEWIEEYLLTVMSGGLLGLEAAQTGC